MKDSDLIVIKVVVSINRTRTEVEDSGTCNFEAIVMLLVSDGDVSVDYMSGWRSLFNLQQSLVADHTIHCTSSCSI